MASFKEAISKVLKNEGGYVNHPNDRGGATNRGITWKTFKGWNPSGTEAELKILSQMDAEQIYFDLYWNPNKYDLFNSQKIVNKVFDTHVNMGLVANKFLQRAYNSLKLADFLIDDGIIGSETIKIINSAVKNGYEEKIINIYCDFQKQFYLNIVEKNPSQSVFLKGWLKRAGEV